MVGAESKISLVAVSETDGEFLYELYRTTRWAEVCQFGWDPEQIEIFLKMQYTMRRRAYLMQFPSADHSIIIADGASAGGIIIDRSAERISLTDIAVHPQFRGKGIATQLIRTLQKESFATSKPIVLQVDKANVNAFELYKKLGFEITEESQLMYEMEWRPSLEMGRANDAL